MRRDSRRLDELRSIRSEYLGKHNGQVTTLWHLGQTLIALKISDAPELQFNIHGAMKKFSQLCVKHIENVLQQLSITKRIEVDVIVDDGSVQDVIWQSIAQSVSPEISKIAALTLGVVDEVICADLSQQEEEMATSQLFILQEVDGANYGLLTAGHCPNQALADMLVIGQGLINQLETESTSTMETKEIVIATKNLGKAREYEMLFGEFGYTVKTLQDFPELPEIIENGTSFTENAQIKAETLSNYLKLPVLGDDSGLCVDYLEGMPGIYSARFA